MNNTNSSYTNSLLLYDYLVVAITAPIGIFVFSTNAILLYVISKSKDLKDPTYTMISYIMALDCLGAIQYILTYCASLILQYSTGSTTAIFCKAMFYILCCSLTSSTSLFSGISYYRYKIVATASQTRSKEKELTVIKRFIFFTCIISCIINIPVFFFSTGNERYCDVSYIVGFEYLTPFYFASMAAITYVLPLIIILVNYSRLIIKLKNYVTPINSQSIAEKRVAKNNRILKMLIIVTGFFMISAALFYSVLIFLAGNTNTFASLARTDEVLHMIVSLSLPLSYINNILNPIIYMVYDKNIREAVKLKLRRKKFNVIINSQNQMVTEILSPTSIN